MTISRLFSLALFACALLFGCGQIDQAMMYSEQADAVATDLKDVTGIRPSTSASWKNDDFSEFVVEFKQAPTGFTTEDIVAHASASIARHFDASPQHLKVTIADSDD